MLNLLSLSMIDTVAKLVLGSMLPRDGLTSCMLNCSFSSNRSSSITGTVMTAEVEPGVKVTSMGPESTRSKYKEIFLYRVARQEHTE